MYSASTYASAPYSSSGGYRGQEPVVFALAGSTQLTINGVATKRADFAFATGTTSDLRAAAKKRSVVAIAGTTTFAYAGYTLRVATLRRSRAGRHYQAVPERGHIGIHNRSHYEEVLVTRVHPEFILRQNIPSVRSLKDIDAAFWEARYAAIRAWEEHLADSGTVIMKFYLNMSRKEQKKRFLERIDDPAKNWKFNAGDVKERAHWDTYMKAYEAAIGATAAPNAPWYIIPADEQWETRAMVGRILREQLEALHLEPPRPDPGSAAELKQAKADLLAEKD